MPIAVASSDEVVYSWSRPREDFAGVASRIILKLIYSFNI